MTTLPTELCLKILYEYKGLITPSAIVMREYIDENRILKNRYIDDLVKDRDEAEENEEDESDPEFYDNRIDDIFYSSFVYFITHERNEGSLKHRMSVWDYAKDEWVGWWCGW